MDFDSAVRLYFGVTGDDWRVTAEVRGGGEFQIGDMTWDREDESIELSVARGADARSETFSSLPAVWDALTPELRRA